MQQSFFSSDASVPGVWPDWIRGRVVEETTTGLGTSTVKINLPVLTEEQRNNFQTFEVEWRKLGASSWEKTTTSTTSSSVNLPGELSDGSYEVRVRATGTGGTTLYTMPLRFPLRAIRKSAKHKLLCGYTKLLFTSLCLHGGFLWAMSENKLLMVKTSNDRVTMQCFAAFFACEQHRPPCQLYHQHSLVSSLLIWYEHKLWETRSMHSGTDQVLRHMETREKCCWQLRPLYQLNIVL